MVSASLPLAFLLCVFAGLIGSDASHRPGDGNGTITLYTDVFLTCWMANSELPKCRLFLTEAFLVRLTTNERNLISTAGITCPCGSACGGAEGDLFTGPELQQNILLTYNFVSLRS